jgi:hypothetical protein
MIEKTETTNTTEKTNEEILLDALRQMRRAYGRLHDGLSDMIEGMRLLEADIPDDYDWLVIMLTEHCLPADQAAKRALENYPTPELTKSNLRVDF